jgi:nucleoside-diphosphate-sugar epimerase
MTHRESETGAGNRAGMQTVMPSSKPATLLTGGSGYLGTLTAAALLAEEARPLVLPVRPGRSAEECRRRLRIAVGDRGVADRDAEALLALVAVIELPPLDRLGELDAVATRFQVDEIVHCAGCVDYFDKRRLQIANVELTARLLAAARPWGLRRFIYLSTAYCSGYRTALIRERLHTDPPAADEPTEYTRTKRAAEWCIAESGLSFVIIRPAVVIGHSRTGVYRGKNYGLYQMWRAFEGLLCREYAPVWHIVAPAAPVDFVHQDAFQNAFMGIYRSAPPGAIVHLLGDPLQRPTMQDLVWQWAEVYWPREIRGYAGVDDVPLESIPKWQRRFLVLAAKNFEIATHSWTFETTFLANLRTAGLPFADATLATIAICQERYIAASAAIQEHRRRFAARPGGPPRFVDMTAGAGRLRRARIP